MRALAAVVLSLAVMAAGIVSTAPATPCVGTATANSEDAQSMCLSAGTAARTVCRWRAKGAIPLYSIWALCFRVRGRHGRREPRMARIRFYSGTARLDKHSLQHCVEREGAAGSIVDMRVWLRVCLCGHPQDQRGLLGPVHPELFGLWLDTGLLSPGRPAGRCEWGKH